MISLHFDNGDELVPFPIHAADIGTTTAWGNLTRWADAQPGDALAQLAEHGATDDPAGLETQLRAAVTSGSPPDLVRVTALLVLDALRTRGPSLGVYVNDGT